MVVGKVAVWCGVVVEKMAVRCRVGGVGGGVVWGRWRCSGGEGGGVVWGRW